MDFLKLAADTAAIITNGARPKTIINAGSALLQLSRESATKNLMLAETQALYTQMEADRLKIWNLISPKVEGPNKLGIADYPFERAWIDIDAYFRAGTTESALASVTANAAKDKKDEETKRNALSPATKPDVDRSREANAVLDAIQVKLGDAGANRDAATVILQKIIAKLRKNEELDVLLNEKSISDASTGAAIRDAIIEIREKVLDDSRNDLVNEINAAIVAESK